MLSSLQSLLASLTLISTILSQLPRRNVVCRVCPCSGAASVRERQEKRVQYKLKDYGFRGLGFRVGELVPTHNQTLSLGVRVEGLV